jgi:hypothetical protein
MNLETEKAGPVATGTDLRKAVLANGSEHTRAKPLTQQEAWDLAVIVFGSELPSPRRDICGTSSDGIRFWRAEGRRR